MADANSIPLPSGVKDQRGREFGRLTVVEFAGLVDLPNGKRTSQWLCRCDCGGEKIVRLPNLLDNTRSCGCLHRERAGTSNRTHGQSKLRLYQIWREMIRRCHNPKNERSYSFYGARGIIVCEEWRGNFDSFRDWSLANGYASNLTIDRKENDQPYCPDNCQWTTQKEQLRNRRNSHFVTWNGETKTISAWCELLGLPYNTVHDRLTRGWDVEKALTKPSQRGKKASSP